jgi:hypothetical protein
MPRRERTMPEEARMAEDRGGSHEVEQLNDVVAALAAHLSPDQALEWAMRSAEAVDAKVRALSSSIVAAILAKDTPRRLHRHLHRREHLDRVKAFLGS